MTDKSTEDGTEQTRPRKSEAAFRTISEVSVELDVPQHVLRFWEGRFPQIKPLKRGGGRRYYRPEDVQLLRRIRDLLYREGYAIRGVQKLLQEIARGGAMAPAEAAPIPPKAQPVPRVTPPAELQPPAPAQEVSGRNAPNLEALERLTGELEGLKTLLVLARQKNGK